LGEDSGVEFLASYEMKRGERVQFISNGLFAIHVPDLAKARDFYHDKLGFRLIAESGEQLVFETGRFRLYVNRDDQFMAFVPALEVADYEAAKEFLKSSGCEIVRDWPKSKALYFRDPLGQIIDIKEAKPL
jgi:catechol 2,3-dioxygenase-like lactoylglutathione lyase family enzyme